MLFNSYVFIFGFLPLALCVFHGMRRLGFDRAAMAVLAAASLLFYAWWSVAGLVLLVVLMAANYGLVLLLCQPSDLRSARAILFVIGIAINLGVLGYFKYTNFFLENWSALTGITSATIPIVLPLGLSFFIFQKIALLSDAFKGKVQHLDPIDYVLFVSFFPQLIAGPIVHHSEVMPQFSNCRRALPGEFAEGISLFIIGLSKKVLLADNLSEWVQPLFHEVAAGHAPTFGAAWIGALSYSMQLYFDFSGYSDMAVGLGLLFGVRLPINFNSPYKAESIVDFWRRWHMTLSRFLRDYLYVPLGGNRSGPVRRFTNLAITMALGGFWHGAAWTFVVWGLLHGFYLIVNHGWLALQAYVSKPRLPDPIALVLSRTTTFVAIVAAWVLFRSPDLSSAGSILSAMAGFEGRAQPGPDIVLAAPALALLMGVVWFAPNSLELATRFTKEDKKGASMLPGQGLKPIGAVTLGILFAASVMSLTHVSEFLYFQF